MPIPVPNLDHPGPAPQAAKAVRKGNGAISWFFMLQTKPHPSQPHTTQNQPGFPLSIQLSPMGHLNLVPDAEGVAWEEALRSKLQIAFGQGSGTGLLELGACGIGNALPPALAFWRDFATRFLTAQCMRAEGEAELQAMPSPEPEELQRLVFLAPPMLGGEYLSEDHLRALWEELDQTFMAAWATSGLGLQAYLKALNPVLNRVGRVHFNLAENRKDEAHPFAFLATYTPELSASGQARHQSLGQALQEYVDASSKDRLLSLFLPVQRASESCAWLRRMVEAGEIFHPLRWKPQEAFRLLTDAPELERAGIVLRLPSTWKTGRPSRAKVSARIGSRIPSGLGKDALLDFRMGLSLDGEELTPAEVEALLSASKGLALIRGQWVEVDPDRLQRTLARFKEAQQLAKKGGLSFPEAMRMLSGTGLEGLESLANEEADWAEVSAGPWLLETLKTLRSPQGLASVEPGPALKGQLRTYQQAGLRWLHLLSSLGLGACLADDMGLGKTIQIISLLLINKHEKRGPSLLVAPASLLANWASELERFAPSLSMRIIHPSALAPSAIRQRPADLESLDLLITTYGSLLRVPWISENAWNLAILDEAQAIKNPGAKQTRAVKALSARARIALTGTPVENHLGDLWSIFDFINPGLLGSSKAFTAYTRDLAKGSGAFAGLRQLVKPYILRRLKTDKTVISDLPDKTELKAFCQLSRTQAALYQQAVTEMAQQLEQAEGMQRRGLVLSYLMRFKQICNHPSQWLGDASWAESASGKFARLRELCEEIAERQEKVLVFTQFKEATEPLSAFLASIFGRPGLVLHGETEVKKRKDLVKRFQEDERVPSFVLSIKAGGAGLNLTAASHVIHFDRWWNPSVENQATDRAFRIGQTRNVLVHKFICRGTVEERIDAMIESKRQLSQDVLEGGAEVKLTELGDDELLRLVSLDLSAAMEE